MNQHPSARLAHRIAAAATAVALAGALAACTDPEPAAPEGGGDLVWSTGTPLGTLDIVADQVDGTARRLLLGNVVEGLTRLHYDGDKLEWVPDLATKWEQVDPTTWRFTLRPDVTFSDGSTFDAADVVYSFNRLALPESSKDSSLNVIAGAEQVDDMTVDVKFTAADPFGFRTVATVPVEPDGWGESGKAEDTAVGTGPYVLSSVSDTRDVAKLERNPDYWGKTNPASPDTIEMRIIPDNGARLAALQAKEINVALDLSPDLVVAAPQVLSGLSTEVEILRINAENGPFTDINARLAINEAINIKSLVDDIREGLAVPANGQPIPQTATGYNPDVKAYKYDLDDAKKLIKDAGLVGTTVGMWCATDYWGAVGSDSCQAIAANIEETGLKVNVQLLPFDQWRDTGYLAKEKGLPAPDLLYIQAGSSAYNASAVLTNYFTCGTRSTICDPELKAATEDALAETDADAKEAKYQKVLKLAHDLIPMVPTVSPSIFAATQKDITGTLYGDKSLLYWDEWSLG